MRRLIAHLAFVAALPLFAQTAQDQSNKKPDVETTRSIRREITKTEGMSIDAKNIKIITKGGVVTLRGRVKSAEEKEKVETIARKDAGANTVNSELEIAK
ncbi:BON domain-containing protein [Bryobacter aggregatus]|uniref:BON domain-containing protein n=1 Tax=Bryobacter aggregatus TaxID=360054 RepID=UPI00068A3AEA|nr:BON domain-containing protein [Bryobacter aggregatus]